MRTELLKTSQPEEFPILRKFIEMSDSLCLVSNMPLMIKFINLLQETFHKTLFKHYAYKNSVKEVLSSKLLENSKWSRQDIERAIDSFQAVWSKIRSELINYVLKEIPEMHYVFERDFTFSMNSKLSSFLPGIHGNGMNAYAMIHYLSSVHNETLSVYYKKKSIE